MWINPLFGIFIREDKSDPNQRVSPQTVGSEEVLDLTKPQVN